MNQKFDIHDIGLPTGRYGFTAIYAGNPMRTAYVLRWSARLQRLSA